MVGDGVILGFFELLLRRFRDGVVTGVRNGDRNGDDVRDVCRFRRERGGVFINLSSTIVLTK